MSFTPSCDALLVTEKAPNVIDVFAVQADGTTTGPTPMPPTGQTPFGFAFDRRGNLMVTEATMDAPGAGTASTYAASADGSLTPITGPVPTGQTATCWVAINRMGFAFTTNALSGNISAFRVAKDGTLSLVRAVAATTGGAPIDVALDHSRQFLHVLVNVTGAVAVFEIDGRGRLEEVHTLTGLPPFAQGIVAL